MGLFSLAGSLFGGSKVKKGLTKAAQQQQYSSNAQTAALEEALSRAVAGYDPYTDLGSSAARAQADLLGLGGHAASAGTAGTTDWGAYVRGNPDALANWNAVKGSTDGARFNGDINAFGQYHYTQDGSRRDLSPFTTGASGPTDALSASDAQASAIEALKASPLFESLFRTGEEAILANASATGGIRGGNTQRSLADFGSDTLAQVIQQQLANYGSAIGTGMGAQGAVTNANFGTVQGQNTAKQTATDALLQKILGKAGVNSQNWSNVGSFLDDGVKTIAGLL